MRTGRDLLAQPMAGAALPITTPEGVSLRFVQARAGDRLGAFLLDSLLLFILITMLVVLALLATDDFQADALMWAYVLVVVFLLQTFYFTFFELRGRGMTPGKRRMGIRVMESRGGTLTSSAIVVRNLMRNLEFYLPLSVLLAPEALWPSAPPWARLFASVWVFALTGMPLFNRRRLRVGDLVAGTIVVVAPKARLLGDLGSAEARKEAAEEPRFVFSEAQLDVYGAYELQVLEDVLRGGPGAADERRVLGAVADRIARKIDWPTRIPLRDTREFLLAFYAALRGRLEQRMLFGKRKKDKFSGEG